MKVTFAEIDWIYTTILLGLKTEHIDALIG
jgi:hypothetical protein